ncbi:hypothetical protein [Desulfosporosinus sp. FKB]|uniref:hypothetical protein n=1 Tax=Desulfosporosinus sp. FKB TaxID=1969835 RepID=UPI000B499BAC|nr:hypothetical protein [Desulfosporosinus sp. FKB]
MKKCAEFIKRFTLKGQDSCVRELREEELQEYQQVYNDLITKLIQTGGEIPQKMEIQVINKIVAQNDEDVTPLGMVRVSFEYLARILTFTKGLGIQWQVDIRECTDTHFKELSYFKITVDCDKDLFLAMAKDAGFRYPRLCVQQTA